MRRAAPTRCSWHDDAAELSGDRGAAARTKAALLLIVAAAAQILSHAMSDDEEWKSSFVQGDDAALTAAITLHKSADVVGGVHVCFAEAIKLW